MPFGSDNGRIAGSRGLSAQVVAITTGTPILTDGSDNTVSVGGDAALAAGSSGFSAPAVAIAADASNLSDDSDNAPSVGDLMLLPQLLGDVRQENLDLKAAIEYNTRNIKALEDHLS